MPLIKLQSDYSHESSNNNNFAIIRDWHSVASEIGSAISYSRLYDEDYELLKSKMEAIHGTGQMNGIINFALRIKMPPEARRNYDYTIIEVALKENHSPYLGKGDYVGMRCPVGDYSKRMYPYLEKQTETEENFGRLLLRDARKFRESELVALAQLTMSGNQFGITGINFDEFFFDANRKSVKSIPLTPNMLQDLFRSKGIINTIPISALKELYTPGAQ